MNAASHPTGNADQVIAAIRAWLARGGAETMRLELDAAREAADAMVQDMEIPPHVLDAPVNY